MDRRDSQPADKGCKDVAGWRTQNGRHTCLSYETRGWCKDGAPAGDATSWKWWSAGRPAGDARQSCVACGRCTGHGVMARFFG